jgi:hypothetical protein
VGPVLESWRSIYVGMTGCIPRHMTQEMWVYIGTITQPHRLCLNDRVPYTVYRVVRTPLTMPVGKINPARAIHVIIIIIVVH